MLSESIAQTRADKAGGLGRAAGEVEWKMKKIQDYLNANPLVVAVEAPDFDAFYRTLAEMRLSPDTAGVLP